MKALRILVTFDLPLLLSRSLYGLSTGNITRDFRYLDLLLFLCNRPVEKLWVVCRRGYSKLLAAVAEIKVKSCRSNCGHNTDVQCHLKCHQNVWPQTGYRCSDLKAWLHHMICVDCKLCMFSVWLGEQGCTTNDKPLFSSSHAVCSKSAEHYRLLQVDWLSNEYSNFLIYQWEKSIYVIKSGDVIALVCLLDAKFKCMTNHCQATYKVLYVAISWAHGRAQVDSLSPPQDNLHIHSKQCHCVSSFAWL